MRLDLTTFLDSVRGLFRVTGLCPLGLRQDPPWCLDYDEIAHVSELSLTIRWCSCLTEQGMLSVGLSPAPWTAPRSGLNSRPLCVLTFSLCACGGQWSGLLFTGMVGNHGSHQLGSDNLTIYQCSFVIMRSVLITHRFLVSWGFSHILFGTVCTPKYIYNKCNINLSHSLLFLDLWGRIHLHVLELTCSSLDLKFLVLLPLFPKHWDCWHVPRHPVYVVWDWARFYGCQASTVPTEFHLQPLDGTYERITLC